VGEWCRNCRARRRCRHLAEEQLALARFEFKDPPLLSDDEIAVVLSQLDMLETWAKGVRDYALAQALSGHRIAGWKVVEGRSSRKFTDNASVAARVEAAGKNPYEKKPLSLTALEKLLGKKEFRNLLGDLVVRQEGKPDLVPDDDERPEFVPANVEFSMTEEDCESVEE